MKKRFLSWMLLASFLLVGFCSATKKASAYYYINGYFGYNDWNSWNSYYTPYYGSYYDNYYDNYYSSGIYWSDWNQNYYDYDKGDRKINKAEYEKEFNTPYYEAKDFYKNGRYDDSEYYKKLGDNSAGDNSTEESSKDKNNFFSRDNAYNAKDYYDSKGNYNDSKLYKK